MPERMESHGADIPGSLQRAGVAPLTVDYAYRKTGEGPVPLVLLQHFRAAEADRVALPIWRGGSAQPGAERRGTLELGRACHSEAYEQLRICEPGDAAWHQLPVPPDRRFSQKPQCPSVTVTTRWRSCGNSRPRPRQAPSPWFHTQMLCRIHFATNDEAGHVFTCDTARAAPHRCQPGRNRQSCI